MRTFTQSTQHCTNIGHPGIADTIEESSKQHTLVCQSGRPQMRTFTQIKQQCTKFGHPNLADTIEESRKRNKKDPPHNAPILGIPVLQISSRKAASNTPSYVKVGGPKCALSHKSSNNAPNLGTPAWQIPSMKAAKGTKRRCSNLDKCRGWLLQGCRKCEILVVVLG